MDSLSNFDVFFFQTRAGHPIYRREIRRGREGRKGEGRERHFRDENSSEQARRGCEVESTYRFHADDTAVIDIAHGSVSLAYLSPRIFLSPSHPLWHFFSLPRRDYRIDGNRQESKRPPRTHHDVVRSRRRRRRRRRWRWQRRVEARPRGDWLTDQLIPLFRSLTHAEIALPFSIDRPCLPREQPDRGHRHEAGDGVREAAAWRGGPCRGDAHTRRDGGSASSRARGGRALTGYPRTFVVNAEIVLRQANVAVLVLGAPGARQRRLLLVHHRVEQLQPIHGLALPRIRFPRLHNTPFIAGGGHHCHPLPHSPRFGHRAVIRDSWTGRECRCAHCTRNSLAWLSSAPPPLCASPRLASPLTAPTSVKRAADGRACHLLVPRAPYRSPRASTLATRRQQERLRLAEFRLFTIFRVRISLRKQRDRRSLYRYE